MWSELILGRLAGGVYSGSSWLRIGTVGGILWIGWWTFGFWRHGVVVAVVGCLVGLLVGWLVVGVKDYVIVSTLFSTDTVLYIVACCGFRNNVTSVPCYITMH
jgi:hypothetical protein